MKVSMITLAAVFALSSSLAMAQSHNHSSASSAANASMTSVPAWHSQNRFWADEPAASNGHGINSLGVTTNSGREYNGG